MKQTSINVENINQRTNHIFCFWILVPNCWIFVEIETPDFRQLEWEGQAQEDDWCGPYAPHEEGFPQIQVRAFIQLWGGCLIVLLFSI